MTLQQLQQLRILQAVRDYPSVSIICPTHRIAPENNHDSIRLKDMVTNVTARLLDEFTRHEVEPLLTRLDLLVSEIEWSSTLDGIALFVNADFAQCFYLPFPVKERVVVEESFAIRDLIFAVNRSPRYRTLVLGDQPIRLYEGVRDALQENTSGAFPLDCQKPSGELLGPGVSCSNAAGACHENTFYRELLKQLALTQGGDVLPVVVVGDTEKLRRFHEVASPSVTIAGLIEADHDAASPSNLGQLVIPTLAAFLKNQQVQALVELEQARKEEKVASGVFDVWQAAHEGRGHMLLVENDFRYATHLDASNLVPILTPSAGDPNAGQNSRQNLEFVSDAVDHIISAVLDMGGRVVFVERGALDRHAQIALILRA